MVKTDTLIDELEPLLRVWQRNQERGTRAFSTRDAIIQVARKIAKENAPAPSKRNDGGPAFPLPLEGLHSGMALREYFAAHAPAKVPEWFPWDETGKPEPPVLEDFVPPEHQERARRVFGVWGGNLGPLPESTPEPIVTFLNERKAYVQAFSDWEHKELQHRYFRWRYFYADMMLAQRTRED